MRCSPVGDFLLLCTFAMDMSDVSLRRCLCESQGARNRRLKKKKKKHCSQNNENTHAFVEIHEDYGHDDGDDGGDDDAKEEHDTNVDDHDDDSETVLG